MEKLLCLLALLALAGSGFVEPFRGAEFLNAGAVISTDGVDGLHFTPEAHQKLGAAIAAKVKEILK